MLIKTEAIDTLFFKDGKPFSWGEDNWADGIFPPNPSTFYGAIRSAYLSEHPEIQPYLNSDKDPTLKLKINGIYLLFNDEIHFPLPKDVVIEKKENTVKKLKLLKNNFISSNKLKYLLFCPEEEQVEYKPDAYIELKYLNRYLFGKDLPISFNNISDYKTLEPKIGIARDNSTLTSDEAKIYRIAMHRLENKNNKITFFVNFDGIQLSENGLLKLGGEGKVVKYSKMDNFNLKFNDTDIENIFKLYLATPAIFENGWLPSWIDPTTLQGEYHGIKLELLTAAIGRPYYVGGFDMKIRKPKPMRRAVPAGSVYYFKILNGETKIISQFLHNTAISEFGTDKEGYGLSFIGKGNA